MCDVDTPMMKQYFAIKKQYPDCLLFYRMGDFYELFMDDAHIGARVLNITLTGKSNGKNGRIPMSGVPYHAVDAYLTKLVRAGYKVAICEQLSPPNKKGLVKRDVVRIVTPGTILEEKALEQKENNYIMSFLVKNTTIAFAIADISTGYFATMERKTKEIQQVVINELAHFHPAECILPDTLYNDPQMLQLLKAESTMNIFPFAHWDQFGDTAAEVLKKHFGVATLAGFSLDDKPYAVQAAAALLGYLQETQKGTVAHIKKILPLNEGKSLLLDRSTMLNLELFTTIREHNAKGTLLSVLDHTITAMGGRLLKRWVQNPLMEKMTIQERQNAVAFFLENQEERKKVRELLTNVNDVERLLSRLSVGLGNGRDIVNLKNSLMAADEIINRLQQHVPLICYVSHPWEGKIIIKLIEKYFVPEPPISLREGKIINKGIHSELDHLRNIISGSRDWILSLEKKEREQTGIMSLKVRFNQVFGFYIEVSKTHLDAIPVHYMRKQTLVNAERFITPELKEQEEIILTAEEKSHELEYQLFQKILQKVLTYGSMIQAAAESIAIVDCLSTFAEIAEKNQYVRPQLSESGDITIINGRHPVVEQLLEQRTFVPNSVTLDTTNQLLLITGPNMAGKSVFIRQVALLILLTHIGSFIPADEAIISIVDRIFVRSGASDVITSGLSTFMVEMVETAYILNHATDKSVIIMDEIGRGTSTYDGISIAWSVAEYLVRQTHAKTLFATHYHELQILEEKFPKQIKNFHMSVVNKKEMPIFLHTLTPGGAEHSFGVAVAKLAGVPEEVIIRSNELLHELEHRNTPISMPTHIYQEHPYAMIDHVIHKEIERLDIHQMTPLEALNILAELKDKITLMIRDQKKFLEMD
jgi:DNA mismatch repair protein MutS